MFGWVSMARYNEAKRDLLRASTERDLARMEKHEAQSRQRTLEDRVRDLQLKLDRQEDEGKLVGVPVDACPDCGGDEWVPIATLLIAQHDGQQERISRKGSRLLCVQCGAHYHLTAKGLTKPTVTQPAQPDATTTPDKRTTPPIGVKLPGGRRTA